MPLNVCTMPVTIPIVVGVKPNYSTSLISSASSVTPVNMGRDTLIRRCAAGGSVGGGGGSCGTGGNDTIDIGIERGMRRGTEVVGTSTPSRGMNFDSPIIRETNTIGRGGIGMHGGPINDVNVMRNSNFVGCLAGSGVPGYNTQVNTVIRDPGVIVINRSDNSQTIPSASLPIITHSLATFASSSTIADMSRISTITTLPTNFPVQENTSEENRRDLLLNG